MNDYTNENADIFDEPQKKKGFTFGKLIKWICLAFIIAVCAILFARCYMYNDSPIVKKVITDSKFTDAYNADKENFEVLQYGIKSSWVAIKENRLIEFNYLYYVPKTEQLQFSVKYNLDLPGEDVGLPFKFKLTDSDGNEYTSYTYEFEKRYGYGYYRLCFDGIKLENDNTAETDKNKSYTVTIEMKDADGNYSELCTNEIYNGSTVCRPVDFSKYLK